MTVGILLFDDVEVLDFAGPFEVFSLTAEDAVRAGRPRPFRIVLVAEDATRPVVARGGLRVTPDVALDAAPRLDILVVPGGAGVRREFEREPLVRFLRERAPAATLLASVCTGSMLLGRAGLLAGRRATTHWAALPWMEQALPDTRVVADEHVVTDGDLVTSAGISAGIDMALTVVARICGEPVARETARQMEYPYPEDNRRRVALPGAAPQ